MLKQLQWQEDYLFHIGWDLDEQKVVSSGIMLAIQNTIVFKSHQKKLMPKNLVSLESFYFWCYQEPRIHVLATSSIFPVPVRL